MKSANPIQCVDERLPAVDLAATIDAVLHPESWDEYVAHWISQIGSPPVMGLLALGLATASIAHPGIWPWVGLYLLGAMMLPMAFLLWQVRSGRVTDLDVQLREQRKASFLVTIAGFSATWVVMMVGHAPPLLTLMAGAGVLQWLITFTITLRWKISVHSVSAAGVTVLLLHVFGRPAVPVVITLPLIAWSRVRLRRHTPAQTVAGILLGGGVFLIVLMLAPTLR